MGWATVVELVLKLLALFGIYAKGRSDVVKEVEVNTLKEEVKDADKAREVAEDVRSMPDSELDEWVYGKPTDKASER